MSRFHSQISKDARAAQPQSSQKESLIPTAESSSGARSPGSPQNPPFRQLAIPEVATLLEFVAWVVFCEVPGLCAISELVQGPRRVLGRSAGYCTRGIYPSAGKSSLLQ